MSDPKTQFLRFTSHRHLPQRIILSALSGRPVHISQIRSSSPTTPGLAPEEISFLRLLESVTNGSSLQISYTGTTLTYIPGIITGTISGLGASDGVVRCNLPATCWRGVSWFLVPLCMLAPFSKGPVNVRFEGEGVITSATERGDLSVDSVRTSILPLYEPFGIMPSKLELRVLQRSCAGKGGQGGGGIVELRFGSQIKALPRTLHWNRSPGRVKRIRGVAYCTGVSASNNARMIHEARGVVNALCNDVRIAAQYDQAPLVADKSSSSGKKRTGIGFGLCLIAETSTDGVVYQADRASPSDGGVTPEEIGKQCAYQLLEVVSQGGCVTRAGMATVLTLMAMGSADVGRLRLGREVVGTEDFVTLARDWKKFGASNWGMRDVDDNSGDIIVSVKGAGIGNVGKGAA